MRPGKLVTVSIALYAAFLGAEGASADSVTKFGGPTGIVHLGKPSTVVKPPPPPGLYRFRGGSTTATQQGRATAGGAPVTRISGGTSRNGRYYLPASHISNAACGRYPYPPCKR